MFATVPIGELIESQLNPRRHFDERYIDELAESLKANGLIEPLVVRPLDAGASRNGQRYEIVAGACRFRAAKKAGLDVLDVVVRELSDDQALVAILIENLQRKNLGALEEARAFRQLVQTGRHSAASIAAQIGLSEKYVWDRMKLLDLITAAQQHLEHGRITAGHAILLARLKPADQERALHPHTGGLFQHQDGFEFEEKEKAGPFDHLKAVSVREFEAWVADHVRFNVEHFAKAAPLDFGPVAEQVQAAEAQPGRGKKVVPITHDYVAPADTRVDTERTYGSSAWKRADGLEKSKGCEHSVLGVVVAGPSYGQAFEVCVNRDKCDVHWKAERRARERAKAPHAGGDAAARERKRQETSEHKRKLEAAERQAAEQQWKRVLPAVLEACAEKLKAASLSVVAETAWRAVDSRHLGAGRNLVGKGTGAEGALRLVAAAVLHHEATSYAARKTFPRYAKRLGVDVGKILAADRKAHPAVQTSGVKGKR